ncbi:MAG: hypothetical protein AB8B63_03315 [Granulosicoccus sp.]
MSSRAIGKSLASVILANLLCGWVLAADPATTLQPDEDTFFEKYDKTVDVAGQLRAGLMFGSELDDGTGEVNINDLRMDLSLNTVAAGEKACIRVASRNGAFSATWEITLETTLKAQVITNFPSAHADILNKFRTDELVAIASVAAKGQACAMNKQRYLPTSWSQPNRRLITVYLNADSTDVLIAGKTTSDPLKDKCRILPATEENTAFDTICTLDLTAIADNATAKSQVPSELVVLRKNFSTVMKNISFPLSTE